MQMTWLPYVAVFAILAGFVLYTFNTRRRQMAIEMVRQAALHAGSQVMTTSGLYGTVVERHDDGTVLLSIAPGVEVKWAVAALRDVRVLPDQYRVGEIDEADRADPNPPGGADLS